MASVDGIYTVSAGIIATCIMDLVDGIYTVSVVGIRAMCCMASVDAIYTVSAGIIATCIYDSGGWYLHHKRGY